MGSPATFYIAWGFILLLDIVSAGSFPDSSFIEATEEKLYLLRFRHLQSSSSNPPLSLEQFDLCLADLNLADINADSQLNKLEYLLFLSMNSARYGYAWGDASNMFSLSELPLEFAMLFHSTACMCAYKQDSASVDFGCCQGANEHVVIYADSGRNMTEEQEAYSRLFCSEAYYSYSSTFSPSKSPVMTTMPLNTMSPTVSTTTLSTVAPFTSPLTPTASPVMPNVVTSLPPSTPPPIVATLPPSTPPPIVGTLPPSTPPPIVGTLPPSTPPPIVGTLPPSTPPPIVGTLPPSTPPPIVGTLPPSTPPPIVGTLPPSTPSPIVGTLPSSTMPPTASSTILEIGIEYGISSDCGVTAYDVMNGNDGLTIKEGLITATEVVLVDILNSTYPRQEAQNSTEGAVETLFPQSIPTMPPVTVANSGNIPTMPPATSSFSIPNMPPASGGEDPNATVDDTTTKSLKTLNTVRIRVNGLPSAPLKTGVVGGDDPYNHRRGLAVLSIPEGQPKSSRGYRQPLDKQQQLQKGYRSLVYYTEKNPVIITNVEEADEDCQQGLDCMKVTSIVYVTLEEGDVADEVEAAFRSGFQKSLEDASFFNYVPADTIVCPTPSSTSPSSITVDTSEPTPPPTTPSPTSYETTSPLVLTTQSPSLTPVAVSTTPLPTSITTNPDEPTSPPVAIPTTPLPIATPPTTLPPFPTTLSEPPSSGSEEGPTGPMNVTIQYTFNNDCGLDAEAIMSEEGNTFKDVLVEMTTAATIQILNETFPRVEEAGPERKRGFMVRKRGLVHLDNPTSTSLFSSQHKRNLVYYTDEYPVTIDRIIDVESCDPGFSCLLVISTIAVMLESGDDPTLVREAIGNGIEDSFLDESIYSTVPSEVLECPVV